ncbi:MAG: tyrosine-type recombinase/integrase, partial [Caldithrix sp.]|nr:tyrosine-type recombinase/integrase [Caldithrix sp.]
PRRNDNIVFGPADGSPQWRREWISKRISRILTQIGLVWASCHTFRHTYISHQVMAGVPIITIKDLVGHASIETTLKYAHLAQDHKSQMQSKRPY